MQACRVLRTSARISTGTNASLPRAFLAQFASAAVDNDNVVRAAGNPHEPEQSSARKCVAVLLQKTVSLLPQTLSTSNGALGPESTLFWSNILERSLTELGSGSDQVPLKATIAGEFL